MYDQEIRTEYARNRFTQLCRDRHARMAARRPARRAVGTFLIRVGQRLAPEPTRRRPSSALAHEALPRR
jgi:hypothetical protein